MNSETEKYIDGLTKIRAARNTNRRNGQIIFAIIGVGVFGGAYFPPLGLLAFIGLFLYWYSLIKTAYVKCPRCNKNFGTNWLFPMGAGTDKCQNCNLSFELLEQRSDSHIDEWLEK